MFRRFVALSMKFYTFPNLKANLDKEDWPSITYLTTSDKSITWVHIEEPVLDSKVSGHARVLTLCNYKIVWPLYLSLLAYTCWSLGKNMGWITRLSLHIDLGVFKTVSCWYNWLGYSEIFSHWENGIMIKYLQMLLKVHECVAYRRLH